MTVADHSLYEAERRARIRLEHVQAITDVALSHLELDDLLAELLGRIRDIVRADTCAILLIDVDTNELIARSAVGIEGQAEREVRIPVGAGFAGRIAAEKRPVVLEEVRPRDVMNRILLANGVKSLLGAPLLVRGEAIGVVHVGTRCPRTFTQDDVELLQLVADRAALAIDRARIHAEMLRLDELKLNFVAVASHELRGPVAALYGAAMTLRERAGQLSREDEEMLELTLFDQAERLRRLTEQLLDLSKLEAKAVPIIPRTIGVHDLIEDVLAVVGREGVTVDVRPDLQAFADPLVLERVLSNLVANAFSHGEPPVVVRAEQRDRHLRIAVEDSGPGIPDELAPRIFESFERGGAGQGSGLGLAIARAYARAHGGDLVYDPVGRGARFELFLPTT